MTNHVLLGGRLSIRPTMTYSIEVNQQALQIMYNALVFARQHNSNPELDELVETLSRIVEQLVLNAPLLGSLNESSSVYRKIAEPPTEEVPPTPNPPPESTAEGQ